MKQLLFRFGITLLTFSVGIAVFSVAQGVRLLPGKIQAGVNRSPHSSELNLALSTKGTVLRVGEAPTVQIYISNNGKETVTLVHPGDGSESGWRTPVVQWSILAANDLTQHPAEPDLKPKFQDCGNINALEWNEVFTLAPGETKEMKEWVRPFTKAGSYRVKFLYANRPSIEWKGLVLGVNNPVAMWRIRHSTECTLSSNEVVFTVSK